VEPAGRSFVTSAPIAGGAAGASSAHARPWLTGSAP